MDGTYLGSIHNYNVIISTIYLSYETDIVPDKWISIIYLIIFVPYLLLIIGLELIETLITHTPSSIIDIMLFAQLEMLIHSSNAYELLVGAIAIAILFATRRFLIFD